MNEWANNLIRFRYVTGYTTYNIYKECIRATDKQVYWKVHSLDAFYIINQKEEKLL